MAQATADRERRSRTIRNWLLAILRFAVTRDSIDRMRVLEMAQKIDQQNFVSGKTTFSFFVRASAEICNAIVATQNPKRQTILLRYFNWIDDRRLRVVLEAAVECRSVDPAPPKPARRKRKKPRRGRRSR